MKKLISIALTIIFSLSTVIPVAKAVDSAEKRRLQRAETVMMRLIDRSQQHGSRLSELKLRLRLLEIQNKIQTLDQQTTNTQVRRRLNPVTLTITEAPPQQIETQVPVETGKASYYGPALNGRRTASGEIFNDSLLTAAHRTLPFGTRVRVTNPSNGTSVEVVINDRGPFVAGRIIDLTSAAFSVLDRLSRGVIDVQVQVIDLAK